MSAREALPTGVALAATVTPRVGARWAFALVAGLVYVAYCRLRGAPAPRAG